MSIFRDMTRWGISSFPVDSNGTKRPLVGWKPYQKRLPGEYTISNFDNFLTRNCGVAVVCGMVSGNLECLDFDIPEYYARWRDVLAETDAGRILLHLMDQPHSRYFYLEQSPSGGFHLLYRKPVPPGRNTKLAMTREHKCAIETRGEGGYVIVSPTKGYRALNGSLSHLFRIEEADAVLMRNAARQLNELPRLLHPHTEEVRGVSASEAYRLLLDAGWKEQGMYEEKVKLCRPGKRRGVSALWSPRRGTLYVFSTNAYPFLPERLYTSGQIVYILRGEKRDA